MTSQQKICALLLSKRMEQREKCSVPLQKQTFQQKNSLSRKHQIARLLDKEMTEQLEYLTQESKSGEVSDGIQSRK